jgi:hypothetical protein
LSKHLAWIENARETGGTDDGDPGLEKLTPAGVMAPGAMVGTAEVDRTGRIGPTAAVGEFPTGQIRPNHGTASLGFFEICEDRRYLIGPAQPRCFLHFTGSM